MESGLHNTERPQDLVSKPEQNRTEQKRKEQNKTSESWNRLVRMELVGKGQLVTSRRKMVALWFGCRKYEEGHLNRHLEFCTVQLGK